MEHQRVLNMIANVSEAISELFEDDYIETLPDEIGDLVFEMINKCDELRNALNK